MTKLEKPEFVGKQALLDAKARGLGRSLVGLTLPDKALARHGYVLRKDAQDIGHVTSGTFSPSLKSGIAMGYVRKELAEPGTVLDVDIRGRSVEATVIRLPFVASE